MVPHSRMFYGDVMWCLLFMACVCSEVSVVVFASLEGSRVEMSSRMARRLSSLHSVLTV